MKLSDSDINSHLKTTKPPTASKCKGITPVKKRPVTVLANPQSASRYIFKLQRFGLKRKISKKTINSAVWAKSAGQYSKVLKNGTNIIYYDIRKSLINVGCVVRHVIHQQVTMITNTFMEIEHFSVVDVEKISLTLAS